MPAKQPPRKKRRSGAASQDAKSLEQLVAALELETVVADKVHCHVDRDKLEARQSQSLELLSARHSETLRTSKKEIVFGFTLDLTVPDDHATEGAEDHPLIFISLTYRASYRLRKHGGYPEDTLAAYRNRWAMLHVFPFMRAHVTDLTSRAGLPPLILPLQRDTTEPEPAG